MSYLLCCRPKDTSMQWTAKGNSCNIDDYSQCVQTVPIKKNKMNFTTSAHEHQTETDITRTFSFFIFVSESG